MGVPAGWKNFTNTILGVDDVNDYLMNQAVMVFASATERTAELGTPNEGNVSYLKDSNTFWFYSGSAWTNLGNSMAFDSSANRSSLVPAPIEGMLSYLRDTNEMQLFDGANWLSISNDRVLKAGDTMTGSLVVARGIPSLKVADSRTSVTAFTNLGSVLFSTNVDGTGNNNHSASIDSFLSSTIGAAELGLRFSVGSKSSRSDAIQINSDGTMMTFRTPTYNGDNTGGGAPSYNGESVKPPTTYINNRTAFNVSTGRFTVPANTQGYVLCSFNSLITRPSNTAHAYVEFQVNGVRKSVRTHTVYDIGGNYQTLNNTAIVFCNGGDYVTCNLWTPSATAYGDQYGLGLTFRYLG